MEVHLNFCVMLVHDISAACPHCTWPTSTEQSPPPNSLLLLWWRNAEYFPYLQATTVPPSLSRERPLECKERDLSRACSSNLSAEVACQTWANQPLQTWLWWSSHALSRIPTPNLVMTFFSRQLHTRWSIHLRWECSLEKNGRNWRGS